MEGKIEKSHKRYMEYDPNVWVKEFFDQKTGGYVVVNRNRRRNAIKYKNEGTKYGKELAMVKVFAQNGHAMEMLEEIPRIPSPDVTIGGMPAELKSPKNVNNIAKDARKAKKKQGARLVLFQFEKMTPVVSAELRKLSEMGIHGKYFISGKDKVLDF